MVKQFSSDERSDRRVKKRKGSSHSRQEKKGASYEHVSETCQSMDPSADCGFWEPEEKESFTFKYKSECDLKQEIQRESTLIKIEDGLSGNPNLDGDSPERSGDGSSRREVRGGNYSTLERKVKDADDLTSIGDMFEDLSNIQEWDENEFIPSLEEITADDVQRIKKGMLNGRVYDLGFSHIEEIFPAMKAVKSSWTSKKAESINSGNKVATPKDSVQGVREQSALEDDVEPTLIDLTIDDDEEPPIIDLTIDGDDDYDESAGISSFKRFFGGILDCRLNRPHLWVIKRRHAMINFFNPDERLLRKLEGINEWDIDEPIPLPSQLTRSDRKRIKKGILNGRLYNIGLGLIREMFPKLKEDPSGREIKCPICSNKFKNVHQHIESSHTMSLVICLRCGLLLTSRVKCAYHRYRCEAKLSSHKEPTSESLSEDIKTSNPSTLDQHKNSMSSEDNSSETFCGMKSFERFFGSLSECRVSANCSKAMQKRVGNTMATEIDEEVFKGLSGIKKWKENKPIPPAEQMTQLAIKRIKKGMSKGRLYNLGIEHIRKIFPRFSRLVTRDGLRTTVRFKCPLCSKDNRRKQDLDRHIESQHTMNLIVCTVCKTLCISRRACAKHRCKWK